MTYPVGSHVRSSRRRAFGTEVGAATEMDSPEGEALQLPLALVALLLPGQSPVS